MNNRLYVGNLPFHTTEAELESIFAECGEVVEVKLMVDRDTGRSRGFAFVSMGSEEAARKAIETLDGSDCDGRALRVNEAEQRRERSGGGGGGGGGFSRGGGGGGGGGRDRDRGGRGGDRRGGGRW
jgi:RNA recognition motif-containing protein